MRTAEFIIENFSTDILETDNKTLSSDIGDQSKLKIAANYLGINTHDFESIPFQSVKKEYLRYKFLLLEFELYPPHFKGKDRQLFELYKTNAGQAYQILERLISTTENRFSEFSKGLSDIYIRSKYQSNSDQLSNLALDQSVMYVAEKRGGIEPGFEAVLHQDIVLFLDKIFHGDLEKIREYILHHQANIESIYNEIKDDLPEYMFKMDYQSDPSSDKVHLSKKDVQRTSTVRKAYGKAKVAGDLLTFAMVTSKSAPSEEKNKETFLEVAPNDLVSMFMPAQEQTAFKTVHDNGKLKFMAKSKLLTDVEEFGASFDGGLSDVDNYPSRKLLIPRGPVHTVTDDRIRNKAQVLIPLLAMGDYDKVGSKGQNLLIRCIAVDRHTGRMSYELVCIDCGHMLRAPNPLVKTLLPDGRFTQPRKHAFKNFSALSDAPLSDLMKGVLILAKMSGYQVSPQLIDQYHDNSFTEMMAQIPPGEAERVLDNYIQTIKELAEIEVHNKLEYGSLITHFEQTKGILQKDLAKFYKKFKDYSSRSPIVLDLANNLQKLSAAIEGKTSLLSANGHHGLRHIAITDPTYNKLWRVNLRQGKQIFELSMNFEGKNLELICSQLQEWIDKNEVISMSIAGNKITLGFHCSHLQEVAQLFAEDRIKEVFHPIEHLLIETAYQELDLSDLITAPWFKENKIALALMKQPKNPDAYRLHISADDKKNLDPLFVDQLNKIFAKKLGQSSNKTSLILDFKADELKTIYNKLLLVQTYYDEALSIKKREDSIKEISSELAQHLPISISLQEVNVDHLVLQLSGDAKDQFKAFLLKKEASYTFIDGEESSELFCSIDQFELLQVQLREIPNEIAVEKERLIQLKLKQEKDRDLAKAVREKAEDEARVAEKEMRDNLRRQYLSQIEVVEQEYHSARNTKPVFFSPAIPDSELDEFEELIVPTNDSELTIMLAAFQQYLAQLKQRGNDTMSLSESSWFFRGVQTAKDSINAFSQNHSSAALIVKLESVIAKYPAHHGAAHGLELIEDFQASLTDRQQYITDRSGLCKPGYEKEYAHLKPALESLKQVLESYSTLKTLGS